MSEPRTFKFRQSVARSNHYAERLPEIDKTRVTAVLVRQSKTGADTAYGESRETQLGLQDYGKLLYEEDEPKVELFDEGAGVSGQKRIDQRAELDRLYQNMHKGIVGTIVMAREDRLFRNKHMDQVGAFTRLAEERHIKVIVPPISSASTEERTRIYDFSNYRDLIAFQDKMREAYGYIEGHVKYMHQVKQNKADRGGYDGRALPPGFVVKGKKKEQEIVIYEPWAKEMRKLAQRAQALSWNMGRLAREVAERAYLFPEIPDEDRERYTFKTNIHYIPGSGYKPIDPNTLREWFKNVMYIGWWQPSMQKPDTIVDHHDPILDYALFAEGYAALTGYTLEGEPVEKNRAVTRPKKTETQEELLFLGKLLVKSPRPGLNAYITHDVDRGKSYYLGTCSRDTEMRKVKFLHLTGEYFDALIISRLKALIANDPKVADKVRAALEQIYGQQGDDFVSIHDQLESIARQLLENARKRMKTPSEDPMYTMLEDERDELMHTQKSLEAKKARLGIMDSKEEIIELHSLLSNFDKVWTKMPFEKKQRAFNILINRIEIEIMSMHWMRLTIDWLDALNPRIDVAYIWKAGGGRGGAFTEEEETLIRQHYYDMPKMKLMQLLPKRSWTSIQEAAGKLQLSRKPFRWPRHYICEAASYQDFCPQLDGNYLLGSYETTLHYINLADKRTSRMENPLYALWLLPKNLEGEGGVIESTLEGIAYAIQDAVAAANILTDDLREGKARTSNLARVQRRRELPTRLIQSLQNLMQKQLLERATDTKGSPVLPLMFKLALHTPVLRDIPAKLVGFGPRRERVKNP